MPNREPEEYLVLAQHAEKAAETVPGEIAKQLWQAIAHEYRALAAEKLRASQESKRPENP